MTRLWKVIVAAAVAIVVVSLLLLYLLDVNRHRGVIQSELEKRLHRKVSLGTLSLQLVPLAIRATDVSIERMRACGCGLRMILQ